MRLGYFSEHAYEKLIADVDVNMEKYLSGENWLAEYFSGVPDYYHLSSVNVDPIGFFIQPGVLSDEDKSKEDLANVKIVHRALRGLTPWQATNKYMWTYLCHADSNCYNYIRHRWLGSIRNNTVKTRFFVTTSGSLLNDNAVSRLWWYGHLTFDDSSADPYHLTKVLLTNQTVCTDVIDTLNRMNPTRLQGVLLALEQYINEMGSERGITDRVRDANRRLNRYAAVSVVDFLSKEEVKNLTLEFLRKP